MIDIFHACNRSVGQGVAADQFTESYELASQARYLYVTLTGGLARHQFLALGYIKLASSQVQYSICPANRFQVDFCDVYKTCASDPGASMQLGQLPNPDGYSVSIQFHCFLYTHYSSTRKYILHWITAYKRRQSRVHCSN